MSCRKCHVKLCSRNALFRHLDREIHVVQSEDDNNHNNISEHVIRITSDRGTKKLTKAERRQRQLAHHRRQNEEDVNNIDDWMMNRGWTKNDDEKD